MKRRALGQHYLADPSVVRLMVEEAAPKKTESVVEIGTGKGVLTEALAPLCARLDGYEVDPANCEETAARAAGPHVVIHNADAFGERPSFDVLVSSLPYSRSQDFIEWISMVSYKRGVVLLQEDFVRKILAPPGSRDYRGVSAIAQISSEVAVAGRVGRDSFQPRPKVASAMVTFKPKVRLTRPELSGIKRLFSLRRRELNSVLREFSIPAGADYGRRRVYSLTPDEVYEICRERAEREIYPAAPPAERDPRRRVRDAG